MQGPRGKLTIAKPLNYQMFTAVCIRACDFNSHPQILYIIIFFNIIPPSTPRSPKWLFISGLPTEV
jgi:hypothetical protein